MSAETLALNGTTTPDRAPSKRSGRIWPLLIVMLIGLNSSIVAITIYFASSDRTVAIEPEYYAKALKFDDTIRQREASNALGWTATSAIRAAEGSRGMALEIAIVDRDGRPVADAKVSAVAFASVRSGERQCIALCPSSSSTGMYTGRIRIARAGIWHLSITAKRLDDTFLQETDVLVQELADFAP